MPAVNPPIAAVKTIAPPTAKPVESVTVIRSVAAAELAVVTVSIPLIVATYPDCVLASDPIQLPTARVLAKSVPTPLTTSDEAVE